MRALVKARAAPGLWLEDVPDPEIGINDVLIRVRKTGICGTDLHIYEWDAWAQKTIPVPMVIGHEFVGEVVAVGSNVSDFQSATSSAARVTSSAGAAETAWRGAAISARIRSDSACNRAGAFAEFIALPMTNIWHHGQASTRKWRRSSTRSATPCTRRSRFRVLGEDVLDHRRGTDRLHGRAVVRHAGARHVVVTDLNAYRLELAETMGATVAVDPRERDLDELQRELDMTEGFDVGLEMSGSASAFRTMIDSMATVERSRCSASLRPRYRRLEHGRSSTC